MRFSNDYWNEKYQSNETGWDIGSISTPLKNYIDQLTNKECKILIPGAGNAWEAEYLFNKGFHNTFVLDYSTKAMENLLQRCPDFPKDNIFVDDFFLHERTYDLIIEQTFFSSLFPSQRKDYAISMYNKLVDNGKLVGLLFNHEFEFDGPPFGGTANEYVKLFEPLFDIEILETATNSIAPRLGREIFMLLRKRISR